MGKNARELSRDNNWEFPQPTNDAINVGSLQRIADATELMAKSYSNLIAERDRYQKWYQESQERNSRLMKMASAYRGHITRLKNKLGK